MDVFGNIESFEIRFSEKEMLFLQDEWVIAFSFNGKIKKLDKFSTQSLFLRICC